jgi:hypothetical protein
MDHGLPHSAEVAPSFEAGRDLCLLSASIARTPPRTAGKVVAAGMVMHDDRWHER